ncbi:hypothetical protein WJX82_008874 [Trebouxia sp. C0006]
MMSRIQLPIVERPTELGAGSSPSRLSYANLATCMLDVEAGYCGLCYQSLPSAVVPRVLERCTEFCKQLEADFLRIETVFVYTTPHDKDRVES